MKLKEEAFKRLQELSDLGISKRRAGQILYDEGYFANAEQGRGFVRRHTGANGGESRNNIKWNIGIPIPEQSEYGVREIPKATNGILLLCDIHLPFHDVKTIESALKRKDEYEIIIIQEVFDFYQISKFTKTRTIPLVQEQEAFFQLMEWIRQEAPDKRIIFQLGNHDERFLHYKMREAREFENLIGMEFETIFNFAEYDIEMIPMRNLMHYRGLFIGHGHEIGARGVPVSPARTFALKTKGNFIGGHFHRTSEQITRNIKDEVLGCWSVGCACDLHPLYAPINDWNNGYAVIRPDGDDHFIVKNIKLF